MLYRSFGVAFLLMSSCSWSVAQEWEAPRSGWLYVLDVGISRGQIFLVDPLSARIAGVLRAGYHPDVGLCGNGSKLYVISGPQSSSTLSVVETKTGKWLKSLSISDRAVYTVRPSTQGITCSSNQKWGFVQQMKTVGPGLDEHALLVIDLEQDTLLPHTIPLPLGCGIARLVSLPFGPWEISAQCSAKNSLRLIHVGPGGELDGMKDVALNSSAQWAEHRPGYPASGQRMTTSNALDEGKRSLVLFRGGGGIDELDPVTATLRRRVIDTWNRWMPAGAAVVSGDAGRAFVGSSSYEDGAVYGRLMDTISELSTVDWSQVADMHTTTPFSSLTLSSNNQTLYTVSPDARSVTSIDLSTFTESVKIRQLGEQPSLILVQP